ncbi:MAG: hypothetical protein JOZ90_06765 [Alphaproteobacteria bacterium]|nr:hypothetical protein [Alphaproteobacteria bacterium]MBV9371131.1 hypothetical protein [Alphaproteobacteria bacterium]MBV9900783.1 hypothetical protein [Alphaproteobacteria bacterium]
MVESDELVLPPEAAAEAGTFLRAGGAGEEGTIAALMRCAAELCEGFTGTVLLARGFAERLRPSGRWQALARRPVRAISAAQNVAADGTLQPLPPELYETDIDGEGVGRVRFAATAGGRVRIAYEAGLATLWEDAPAALRHGVIRMAAHLYGARTDGEAGERRLEPPAAVTALWRPYRRLRLR